MVGPALATLPALPIGLTRKMPKFGDRSSVETVQRAAKRHQIVLHDGA